MAEVVRLIFLALILALVMGACYLLGWLTGDPWWQFAIVVLLAWEIRRDLDDD